MISVVNGFVCRSCCEVSLAKQGHDPRNPHDDPVKAAILALKDGKDRRDPLTDPVDPATRTTSVGPLGRLVDLHA